ncbi:MAG: circularly permuted type 2 ATP-grasp protein [Sphingomonadales bacterium]|nr:circularly permuted type 2 ATP-grasp protein [Sphingomonadales bacterium]
MAAKWAAMADGLAALTHDGLGTLAEQVARQIQDLGLTFRLAGDEEERSWPLGPMPLLIGAAEWAEIEAGLIQRAQLLEALAADIYGGQKLVANGHLPAAAIAGGRYFAPRMVGLAPPGGRYLHVCAFDLARGPGGQWRVLADRLRLATGIGYALENRLALTRTTGPLLASLGTRRLAAFFTALRGGIAAECLRERPRVALLTPGRFNQSYPEQAHLARYLGLPLVEGRDLTVIDERLFVRTIAGPKRIDALWRWIDTPALDPLAFDARSAIGVPDLFAAWARGGLVMANWPGVEVLEARAFAAFLPRLAPVLLGEPLRLPNVATWWCGQTRERDEALARLDQLLVGAAFGDEVEGIEGGAMHAGSGFRGPARAALLAAVARRPMDYCAQEEVHLSTSPVLVGGENGGWHLAPRPFTLRAFLARDATGAWRVMPGGFARLCSSGELLTSLMGEGDFSADVCVLDEIAEGHEAPVAASPAVRRGGGLLASQAADNLFWFGRYAERAEAVLRALRSILGSAIEADAGAGRDVELRRHLAELLRDWGAVTDEAIEGPLEMLCSAALAEHELPGGVATLVRALQRVGQSLRDRFARDFWRIARRAPPAHGEGDADAVRNAVKDLLERLAALSGLIAENVVRDDAFRFLDIGRRLERALVTIDMVGHLANAPDEAEAMGLLLDLCDSQIVYRARYLATAARDPVYDLVLLDPDNPRSLMFQLEELARHLAALPALADDGMPEAPLRAALALVAPLRGRAVATLDTAALHTARGGLYALSEAISERYFLPVERQASSTAGTLLG